MLFLFFSTEIVQPLLARTGHPKFMTTTPQDLKKYELMLIFSGEIPEQDFERELEKVKEGLKEFTKKIEYEDLWGKREFTYRVKKQKRGYYSVLDFSASPAAIHELRADIKLNPYILRHLLIALPEDYEYGKYKEQVLREERAVKAKEEKKVKAARAKITAPAAVESVGVEEAVAKIDIDKPKIAGKEEEQELENVEKKLEKILENPDIDIK